MVALPGWVTWTYIWRQRLPILLKLLIVVVVKRRRFGNQPPRDRRFLLGAAHLTGRSAAKRCHWHAVQSDQQSTVTALGERHDQVVLPQGKGPLRQGVPRLERSWNGVCQGRPKVALRSPQGQIKVPAYGGLGYSSRTVSPNASSLVTCY